jgi:hypothetical protein
MANIVLFYSSIFHGIVLLLIFGLLYQQNINHVPWYIIVGLLMVIIASGWNHGSTNNMAKWSDRIITSIITIILLFFLIITEIPHREIIGLGLIIAILLWMSSYQYQRLWQNRIHVGSHTIGTISTIAFLNYFTI